MRQMRGQDNGRATPTDVGATQPIQRVWVGKSNHGILCRMSADGLHRRGESPRFLRSEGTPSLKNEAVTPWPSLWFTVPNLRLIVGHASEAHSVSHKRHIGGEPV